MNAIELVHANEQQTSAFATAFAENWLKRNEKKELIRDSCPYHSLYREMGQKYDMCDRWSTFCDCQCE